MKFSKYLSIAGLSALALGAVVMLVAGCQMPGGHTHANSVTKVASAGKSGKGGAQLWAESCISCHNVRSPSQYSDADWDIVMQHMRVRATCPPPIRKRSPSSCARQIDENESRGGQLERRSKDRRFCFKPAEGSEARLAFNSTYENETLGNDDSHAERMRGRDVLVDERIGSRCGDIDDRGRADERSTVRPPGRVHAMHGG